jgi:hypothetical protein
MPTETVNPQPTDTFGAPVPAPTMTFTERGR